MSPNCFSWYMLSRLWLNSQCYRSLKELLVFLDSEEEMDTAPAPAAKAKKAGMVKAKEESDDEEEDDDEEEEEDDDDEGEFRSNLSWIPCWSNKTRWQQHYIQL